VNRNFTWETLKEGDLIRGWHPNFGVYNYWLAIVNEDGIRMLIALDDGREARAWESWCHYELERIA
jgi:hypothetical protein